MSGGGFEWDPKKAEANRHKHGIEFLDAVIAFDDDRGITCWMNTRRKNAT